MRIRTGFLLAVLLFGGCYAGIGGGGRRHGDYYGYHHRHRG